MSYQRLTNLINVLCVIVLVLSAVQALTNTLWLAAITVPLLLLAISLLIYKLLRRGDMG